MFDSDPGLRFRWRSFIEGLATRSGSLRDGLEGEYIHSLLPVISSTTKGLPAEYSARLEAVAEQITAVEPIDDEGSIHATIATLADDEVRAIVDELLEIAFIVWSG